MDDKKNQLAALKADYQHLRTQTQALNNTFVPPALMANALSHLLKQNNQLTLIKLETLPVKPQPPLVYQHGLVLHFSGNYSDTLAYLTALEAMPWNFVWDSIDYRVKDYPIAEITLRVHTLSLEKSWLDV
jgi:MSHA biogenesis protein MshJ